jgi:hypothetical protein
VSLFDLGTLPSKEVVADLLADVSVFATRERMSIARCFTTLAFNTHSESPITLKAMNKAQGPLLI